MERFGEIALEKGYLTPQRLEECLEKQDQLRKSGEEVEVGRLLLDRGYLSPAQFLEVLAIQKSIPFLCRTCSLLFDTRELGDDRTNCPKCGGALETPRRR